MKVIDFFQDVRKKIKVSEKSIKRHQLESCVTFRGHIGQTTRGTKSQNDVSELHLKKIRCNSTLTRKTNLMGDFDFLPPALNVFLKG